MHRMQVINLPSYLECLSEARMQSYKAFFFTAGSLPTDDELVALYHWNGELAEMLWKLISLIEIALRNKVHTVLSNEHFQSAKNMVANGSDKKQFTTNKVPTQTYGKKQSCNWYHAVNFSGEPLTLITSITHKNMRGKYVARQHPKTPDDVISGLTFGFWRYIFTNLDKAGEDHKNIITKSFPYAPFSNTAISNRVEFKLDCRLDMIHSIRNRISHHEPLWKMGHMLEEVISPRSGFPKNRNIVKTKPKNIKECCDHLKEYHNQMIDFLSWIDRNLAASYKSSWWHDRMVFICSMQDVGSVIKSSPITTEVSYKMLKRNIRAIAFRDKSKIISKGSKRSLIIPLR